MYEEQFGFNKRPFRATPRGAEVFVGPQTAQTMQSLKKALTTSDGVVTVTGPAGAGKTTQVLRALEAIDAQCTCIRIGRMHLGPDEILEFLLAKLGVQAPPTSTIRRVVFFRAAVMKQRLAGHRVFIVVEDAQRLGLDALAELEALTGAENGDGDGANLILMAPQSLKPLLRSDGLERLDQRVRLRHQVSALNEPELRAYLKHCFRLAGAEFDLIFTDGGTKQLFNLSNGIPRVANNLVESVLTAAAERGMDKIGPDLVSEIAGAEYEMTVETQVPSFEEPVAEAEDDAASDDEPADTPVADDAVAEEAVAHEPGVEEALSEEAADEAPVTEEPIEPEAEFDAPIAAEPVADEPILEATPEAEGSDEDAIAGVPLALEADTPVEAEPLDIPEIEAVEATTIVNDDSTVAAPSGVDESETPSPEPAAEFGEPDIDTDAPIAAEPVAEEPVADGADLDIPELIQDTLPDLEVLAPEVMERSAITGAELDAEDIPTLYSSMRIKSPLAELAGDADGDSNAEPVGGAAESAGEIPEAAAVDPIEDATASTGPAAPSVDAPEPLLDVETASLPDNPPAIEPEPAPEPAVVTNNAAPATAEVLAAAQVEPAAAPGELPAWDRDPTLAELKPDIDALELAIADMTDSVPIQPVKQAPREAVPEVELKDPTMPSLPEITLDAAIEEKIREAEEALEKHDATIAEDEEMSLDDIADGDERDTRADAELEKIAEGLARAKTIEDVDDQMAETLFGEEISLIAAQVTLANPANEPVAEGIPADEDVAEPAPVDLAPEPVAAATPAEPESEFEKEFREVYGENVDISLETKPKPGMDLSASQRLATVRALNQGIVQPGSTAEVSAAPNGLAEPPASIEDQIDTSLSQTIKTLNIDGAALIDDDEDEDETESKRGFFSRFRRS